MAQIRNRYDIENSIEDEKLVTAKRLPKFFNEKDGIGAVKGLSLSVCLHIVFILVMLILNVFMGFVLPHLPKPELQARDIEFKLVQAESKPPINKKTAIRSDRDSRAGGKHDPTRPVSEPSPSAQKASKPQAQPKAQPAPAKQAQKPQQVKQPAPQKVVSAPAPVKPTPAKPAPVKAPSVAKPTPTTTGVPAPTAPKIATAPKSPFSVPVAPSNAPVGTTYKPAGTPSSSGGTSSGGSGSGAPSPKFSSSGGGSGASKGSTGGTGSGGNKYASRGTGGYGTGGNPSPGNPNGTPGIDAVKQPNWGPYMRDLEQRIKRNWSPPKGDSSKRVVITFTISRDGRLLSHNVTKSSGVPLADRAAMSAIELTAPFRPLPPEFKGQSVPIEFTFDYNVISSTKLK